jgi:hypothetical protein
MAASLSGDICYRGISLLSADIVGTAGGAFFYIANSQAYSFNPDGTLFPADKLKEIVILRVDLKHK